MVNSIYSYLVTEEAQGFMNIGDIAKHGVASAAPRGLTYNVDIVDFFNKNIEDIEAVIFYYVEDILQETFYDIINIELMELLNEYANTSFTEEDEMLDLMRDEATQLAETHEDWYDMNEEGQEELIWDCMEDVEVLPTTMDKVQFVWLAVELVAQDIMEERGEDL